MLLSQTQPQFNPLNLYGTKFWGDATQTPTGAVASWTDQSGNGNHATQATGGKQPICTANQQGGQNSLLFASASSQTLALPAALYSIANGNNTIFAVSKIGTITNGRIITLSTAAASKLLLDQEDSTHVGYQNANSTGNVAIAAATLTNYNIFTGYFSGSTLSLQVNNGAAITNLLGAAVSTVDAAYIGSRADTSLYMNGGICELIIYNRALSALEILTMNQYLSQKWGIAIS